jgi:PTH1 family peptidyl-tRNA hydrolase
MWRRILPWHDKRIVEGTKLIVGLGNPGSERTGDRHNVGFQVLDRLSHRYRLPFDRLEFKGLLARGTIEEKPVILLKPLSYMNLSGSVVKPVLNRYSVGSEEVLIVHDDLDLPLGRIRMRAGGGSGGHRGMTSIIASLGTESIARLRIGIGRPDGEPPEEYVLADFTPEQSVSMEAAYEKAVAATVCFIEAGVDVAMNEYNQR